MKKLYKAIKLAWWQQFGRPYIIKFLGQKIEVIGGWVGARNQWEVVVPSPSAKGLAYGIILHYSTEAEVHDYLAEHIGIFGKIL